MRFFRPTTATQTKRATISIPRFVSPTSSRCGIALLVMLVSGTTRVVAAQASRVNGADSARASASRVVSDAPLPFSVGEQLSYSVSVSRFGKVGKGTMSVEGPEDVRGHRALLLRFVIRGRVGLVAVENTTQSWIEPSDLASLRFTKHERQFFRSRDERVEIFPHDRRWSAAGDTGDGGATLTDAPLDELSFLYFLRTLPLDPDSTYTVSRHFQAERNPVLVTVLRREVIETPAGSFPTILVEMRVKDARHYEHEGVLRLNLSDDADRLPVRIETSMPVVGKTVLLLERRRQHQDLTRR